MTFATSFSVMMPTSFSSSTTAIHHTFSSIILLLVWDTRSTGEQVNGGSIMSPATPSGLLTFTISLYVIHLTGCPFATTMTPDDSNRRETSPTGRAPLITVKVSSIAFVTCRDEAGLAMSSIAPNVRAIPCFVKIPTTSPSFITSNWLTLFFSMRSKACEIRSDLFTKHASDARSDAVVTVSYTHLRAHETDSYLVCRLLLEKKKKYIKR